MNLKETYNRIAEDWHRDHLKDDWWVSDTERFVSLLPSQALVLDVGCAGGTKSRWLKEHGMRVIGIDISEKMIEIATRECPECDFRVLDMHDIGTLPETFDGIFAQAAFLHLPKKDVPAVVAACVSRLDPDGLLYAAVKEVRPGRGEEEQKTESDYGYDYTRFFSYFTLEEMRRLFSDAGLTVVHAAVTGGWIQIIGRKLVSS